MSRSVIRALIVEDEQSWQHILSEILADVGLVVDVASDLDTAIASIRATPHRLAVVDLCLGGSDHHNRDGIRVLEAIRLYDPGCVSLLLTGYATVELAVSALTEQGAFTCLRKENFTRADFRWIVRQALASPQPWTSAKPGRDGGESAGGLPERTHTAAAKSPSGVALVVEDDAGWRSIFSELLSEVGYEVHLCNGLGEALGCLGRERYDVAVVDLSLVGQVPAFPLRTPEAEQGDQGLNRDLDGYRLLACTQATGLPTIVVSGVTTPPEIERIYVQYGIFACLEKQTFDRHAFLRTVRNLQAADRADSELDRLTERQRQVLALLAKGMANKDIAETLMISTNTVKRHLKAIYKILGVHARAAAVARAVSAGLPGGVGPWPTGREDNDTP